MSLILNRLQVRQLQLGEHTNFDRGVLTIDSDSLASTLIEAEPRLLSVFVQLAQPGEPTRILCVKDVIQPSLKLTGEDWGSGTRLLLDDVAVVTSGTIIGFQEGIIDMSGPGAAYSPFSGMPLLVLEFDVVPGLPPHEHEEALRKAGILAAEYLAEGCLDAPEITAEEVFWNEVKVDSSLPRIAYVLMALSQGLLHDTYVRGKNANHDLPISVDPRVVLDGGLISGNCVSACDKNTSFHHRNNPIINELLSGHGSLWNFVGVVISNEPVRLADKESSAAAAVELVTSLQANGVIVSTLSRKE
jgi:glycine reductase